MSSTNGGNIELRAAVLTDVGVVREHNEDSARVDDQLQFFVVADGMGGHAAGEVASDMAVTTVSEALAGRREDLTSFATRPTDAGRHAIVELLENAVRTAHQAVYQRGISETDKQGMGTTLDVVLVAGPEAFVAHVGDSRTYLMRDGRISQVTTDHTVAEVLVIEGKLTVEEAQISPLRTILVNAIGVAPDVGVEMAHIQLRKDDKILLCSDGLHDYFTDEEELASICAEAETIEDALKVYIDLAKDRGGHDNITGVLFEVLACPAVGEGIVEPINLAEMSDGVPAPIERDDTVPVESRSSATRTVERLVSGAHAGKREVHRVARADTDPGADDPSSDGPATSEKAAGKGKHAGVGGDDDTEELAERETVDMPAQAEPSASDDSDDDDSDDDDSDDDDSDDDDSDDDDSDDDDSDDDDSDDDDSDDDDSDDDDDRGKASARGSEPVTDDETVDLGDDD